MKQEEQKLKISPVEENAIESLAVKSDWVADLIKILLSKKTILMVLVLIGLVSIKLGVTYYLRNHHQLVTPTVRGIRPTIKSLDSITSLPGNMEALEQASLYAHVSGYLKKIYVDEGDKVKRGQVLALIDAPDVLEDYNKYKAELNLKSVTYKRYNELLKENVISQQEFDTVDAAYEESKARFQSAAASMEYTKITAPFSGSIARRYKYPGDLISTATKGDQTPIFLLVNENQLRVVVNVPQIEVAHIKVGDTADVKIDAFAGKQFPGKVSRLDALLDESTKTQRVLIELNNADGQIRAGMYATVVLHFEHKDSAVTVPAQIIQGEGDKAFVYLFKDGKAVKTPVTLGLKQEDIVEISSGVKGDDIVIDRGMIAIGDGSSVNILQ